MTIECRPARAEHWRAVFRILFLAVSLLVFAGCNDDADGDGWTACPETVTSGSCDCDDSRSDVFPGNDERCDGIDNDCNGIVDRFATLYPGGESLDALLFPTIQEAIDAAEDGDEVIVSCAGTYEENLVIRNKSILVGANAEGPLPFLYTGGFGMWTSYTAPDVAVTIEGDGDGPAVTIEGPRADSVLVGLRITGGSAQLGGGIYVSQASPNLVRVAVEDNEADSGGGIAAIDTPWIYIAYSEVVSNHAYLSGGGIYLEGHGDAMIFHTFVRGNRARQGGGIDLEGPNALVQNVTVSDNTASLAGGLLVRPPSTTGLWCSILAYNVGYNVYNDGLSEADFGIGWSLLYSPSAFNHHLGVQGSSLVELEPGFLDHSSDGDAANDDLHVSPLSPVWTAPTSLCYRPWGPIDGYYTDNIAYDGMWDGWERVHGLEPDTDDAGQDPDGDGLTNKDELTWSSDPFQPDSDGDGASDGAEVEAGTLPADWYSQPGVEGVAEARVPEDFATVQAAIDAIRLEGRISIGAGTWTEDLSIENKIVTIAGQGVAETTLNGAGGTVVTALAAVLTLRDLTITGGSGVNGGGLALAWTDGTLEELEVVGNLADQGGGLYLLESSPTITRCSIRDNIARNSGGGLYLASSNPRIEYSGVSGNSLEYLCCDDSYFGDGAFLIDADPIVENCTIRDSIYMRLSSPSLTHSRIYSSMIVEYSIPTLRNMALIEGNLNLCSSSPRIENSIIAWAEPGVTYEYCHTYPLLMGTLLYASQFPEETGATISAPTIVNSILFTKTGWTLFVADHARVDLRYSDIYAGPCETYEGGACMTDETDVYVDPKLEAYDPTTEHFDLHLATDSPLIGKGSPALLDVDGSVSDPGIYGGPGGGGWDLDADGFPDYYWPGTMEDAPAGVNPADFDCDDQDATTHECR